MSIRATNFVRGLRGLSPTQKAVAFVLADHDDHRGGGCFASMQTVAEEAGLQHRETASRITKEIMDYGIVRADNPSKGRKPTVYRFNYDLANRDVRVTVENPPTVTPESRLEPSNRDSGLHPTVTQTGPNRDSPVTRRVLEGLEGRCSLLQLSQDQQDPKLQEPVQTRSRIKEAIGKTANSIRLSAATNGGQRAHLEAAIYRKKISSAYFDATNEGMKPDECIRDAIYAGALSLVGNRSVELKGLDHDDLARNAWERIRNGVAALHEMKNFDMRSKQVVAVVTRCLTDAALEFWERACAGVNAATNHLERGEHRGAA